MNVRKIRLALWMSGSALLVLAVGLVAMAVCYPWMPRNPTATTSSALPKPQRQSGAGPGLEQYALVWNLNLQRPLYDPPPPPMAVPQRPVFAGQLTGTAIEDPSNSVAFFLVSGAQEMKGVGEKVAGAEILSIGADSVRLKYYGEVIELKVRRERE